MLWARTGEVVRARSEFVSPFYEPATAREHSERSERVSPRYTRRWHAHLPHLYYIYTVTGYVSHLVGESSRSRKPPRLTRSKCSFSPPQARRASCDGLARAGLSMLGGRKARGVAPGGAWQLNSTKTSKHQTRSVPRTESCTESTWGSHRVPFFARTERFALGPSDDRLGPSDLRSDRVIDPVRPTRTE